MANKQLESFSVLLDRHASPDKSLILGNGFGRSYDEAFGENRFSWNTLADLCNIKSYPELFELLTECDYDFEVVHQKLRNASGVIARYSTECGLPKRFDADIQTLREQLIIAVNRSHPMSFNKECPETQKKVIEKKVAACRHFLERFKDGRVFSLNYDLLLYWVRCYDKKQGTLGKDSFTDGKGDKNGKLVFKANKDANYFFPHGALFLSRDGRSAIKLSGNKTDPILSIVEKNIRNNAFPLCVSEGTGKRKHEVINDNDYLRFAYEQLQKLDGTIFTFGCSFRDGKDDHIIEALCQSNVSKIVVGAHKPSEDEVHRLCFVFTKIRGDQKTSPEIVVADTTDLHIWGTVT